MDKNKAISLIELDVSKKHLSKLIGKKLIKRENISYDYNGTEIIILKSNIVIILTTEDNFKELYTKLKKKNSSTEITNTFDIVDMEVKATKDQLFFVNPKDNVITIYEATE